MYKDYKDKSKHRTGQSSSYSSYSSSTTRGKENLLLTAAVATVAVVVGGVAVKSISNKMDSATMTLSGLSSKTNNSKTETYTDSRDYENTRSSGQEWVNSSLARDSATATTYAEVPAYNQGANAKSKWMERGEFALVSAGATLGIVCVVAAANAAYCKLLKKENDLNMLTTAICKKLKRSR